MGFINTWQFSLVMFYIFNVIFFQFYKLSLKTVTKDGAATVIFQVLAGFSQLLLIPFFAWRLPDKTTILLLLGAASVFYAINDRLQVTVRKNLEVSAFSILSQLGTVFLIIYGLTIFREPFVATKILGAALIVFANIGLLYKPGKGIFVVNRYYVIGAIALLAYATAVSIDIGISEQFNLPFYIALTLLIPAAMIILIEKMKSKDIAKEWRRGNKNYFIITGIAWGLMILFGLRAFQLGEVSTVVPLTAVSIILNVLAAFIFLKERGNRLKKIIAATVVMLGIYLTVL